MSTLSTAPSNTTDTSVPTDIDNEPIKWNGNRAALGNIIEELENHFARTGRYRSLITEGCVSASNGKLIVDSVDSIPFIQGSRPSSIAPYSFRKPCPRTAKRVAMYQAYQAANPSSPAHTTPTQAEIKDLSVSYMINPFATRKEDSDFFTEIMHVMSDLPDRIEQFTTSSIVDGQPSGRQLITDLTAEHSKANHRDRALMVTIRDKFVAAGLCSELTLSALDKSGTRRQAALSCELHSARHHLRHRSTQPCTRTSYT